MSVKEEVNRIKANITNALTAISTKGVIVPTDANSDDLVSLIKQIKVMGSFTVDGTPFQFELGMTWDELLQSDYNVDGQAFLMDDDGFILYNVQLCDSSGVAVYKDDPVINGMAYKT